MDLQPEPSQYQNVQQVQKTSQSNPRIDQHKGAFKLAGVGIGLVCILQGTLNIVLRIYFNSQLETDPTHIGCNNQTSYLNLIKERDQLQKANEDLKSTLDHLVGTHDKPGWIYYNSSLYCISKEVATWDVAKKDCISRGANLVIVNSREEQVFVEALRLGQTAWIGLSDQDVEGKFKWVDGSELTIRFWASREPNDNFGNEDCVITGFEPHDGRQSTDFLNTWNDEPCSDYYRWICEQPISLK